jgi:diguanylate cyclase (GGDEF)-like protein
VGATGAATALFGVLTASRLDPKPSDLALFAALALLAALTDLFAVKGIRHSVYDTAGVFLVAAAVLLPIGFAPLVALPACILDAHRRRASAASLLHNAFAAALATLAAAACVRAGGFSGADGVTAAEAAVLCGAALAYALTLGLLDGAFSTLARGSRFPAVSRYELGAEFVLATMGVTLAAFWAVEPWLAPFALTPLIFIHRSQRLPALEEEAVTDSKTGLYNMRGFEAELDAVLERARSHRSHVSLIVADLDLLREINNEHGHLAGDAVIHGISELLRGVIRNQDIAARFGGEEFLLALPNTRPEDGVAIAERIRSSVASRVFTGEAPPFATRATVSIGVASFPRDGDSTVDLIHAADLAVLAAKRSGRNRVVQAETLRDESQRAARS